MKDLITTQRFKNFPLNSANKHSMFPWRPSVLWITYNELCGRSQNTQIWVIVEKYFFIYFQYWPGMESNQGPLCSRVQYELKDHKSSQIKKYCSVLKPFPMIIVQFLIYCAKNLLLFELISKALRTRDLPLIKHYDVATTQVHLKLTRKRVNRCGCVGGCHWFISFISPHNFLLSLFAKFKVIHLLNIICIIWLCVDNRNKV